VRRIVRSDAVCLRVQDYHESSKLVTFFTLEHGKVSCIAKGARRLKSKFGAALGLFAESRIIYYWHEGRTLYTLSDAELIRSHSRIAESPERYLAAEQMAEFTIKAIQPQDTSPQLYQLLLNYLGLVETRAATPSALLPDPFAPLVCSYLLKAASFLGFRPELRRCLICKRPPDGTHPVFFDAWSGGIICSRCSGERVELTEADPPDWDRVPSRIRLEPEGLDILSFLLYTPASEIASVSPSLVPNPQSPVANRQSPILDLVLSFLSHHFDPLVLNSFRWRTNLDTRAKPAP
jgi:DNA repair protein RecO (recombination protein O)